MNLIYRKASLNDLELLIETRIQVLKVANMLKDSENMTDVQLQSDTYYKKTLSNGLHVAYLIFDADRVVGTGGVSFFQVMPTFHNPTGKKAYIMNMYTDSRYRRRGIAYKTLDLLVSEAKERGISAISLEATAMGRPLYEKYGFVEMKGEMELK